MDGSEEAAEKRPRRFSLVPFTDLEEKANPLE